MDPTLISNAKSSHPHPPLTVKDQFLALVNETIQRHLNERSLSELEKMGLRASIYHIFEKHNDIETIYFELVKFFEHENGVAHLIPSIKKHYQTIHQF